MSTFIQFRPMWNINPWTFLILLVLRSSASSLASKNSTHEIVTNGKAGRANVETIDNSGKNLRGHGLSSNNEGISKQIKESLEETSKYVKHHDDAPSLPTFDEIEYIYRPLESGDIFTPIELLPVTKKLLKKLEIPCGGGKGIVGSSKSAEELADKIFAAYFLTTKRIVILKETDIHGLDALQALALEGEPVNSDYFVKSISDVTPAMLPTTSDTWFGNYPGYRTCHYKLLAKREKKVKTDELKVKEDKRRRFALQLEKKLVKDRLLILNSRGRLSRRLHNRKYNHPRSIIVGRQNTIDPIQNGSKSSKCKWLYDCKKPGDLNTCNIVVNCNETGGVSKDKPTGLIEDPNIARFRRMLGLTQLDELVERIIESHIALIQPSNFGASNRAESLDEYFHKIIVVQQNIQTTTPIAPSAVGEELTATSAPDIDSEISEKAQELNTTERKPKPTETVKSTVLSQIGNKPIATEKPEVTENFIRLREPTDIVTSSTATPYIL